MKKSELDGFRKTLANRQAELSGHRDRDALAIETSANELDRIQHAQERDLAVGAFTRECFLLREVTAALQRFESDSFGSCLKCEEEISPKRLAAVPWAAYCIICQEAVDRTAREAPDEDQQPLVNVA